MTRHSIIKKPSVFSGEETNYVKCAVLYLIYLVEQILFNRKIAQNAI